MVKYLKISAKIEKTEIAVVKQFVFLTMLACVAYVFSFADAFAGNSYGGLVFLGLAPSPLTELASDRFTAGDTPTGGTLCMIVAMVNSGIGRGIAALCVIFLGLGAMFGKVRWEQAIMVGVGIAMVLGASTLVGALDIGTEVKGTRIEVQGVDGNFEDKGKDSTCN